MRHILALASAVVVLGGCASGYDGSNLTPGKSTEAQVIADMGTPKDKRPGPDGATVLWFPRLPDGRVSYAATIGKDGKLINVQQRLTKANLELLKPGVSTDKDVLDLLGPPQNIEWFEREQINAWSYNAQGIEPQIYVVEVRKDGVVNKRYSYDDPQFIQRR
jgi:hypothetical protein